MPNHNRLVAILENLALRFELPYKLEGNKVTLGITHKGKLISAVYKFDNSGDRYEFGAPLADVDKHNIYDFVLRILTSQPMRGVTERIVDDKFVILGWRSNLKHLTDDVITTCFRDDIARIASYYDKIS